MTPLSYSTAKQASRGPYRLGLIRVQKLELLPLFFPQGWLLSKFYRTVVYRKALFMKAAILNVSQPFQRNPSKESLSNYKGPLY